MNTNPFSKAMRLLSCIGGIQDSFIEEAESAVTAPESTTRKRLVRYGTIAAAASVGIAVTYFLIRSKRAASKAENASAKSA